MLGKCNTLHGILRIAGRSGEERWRRMSDMGQRFAGEAGAERWNDVFCRKVAWKSRCDTEMRQTRVDYPAIWSVSKSERSDQGGWDDL